MFNDPHAAQRVLTAGWPLTLVGLDVTHRCVLTPAHMQRIEAGQGELGRVLAGSYAFYRDFYREFLGIDGCCPHDSCALAWLLRPELFTSAPGHLAVVTEGAAEGQTIFAPENRGFIQPRWSQTPGGSLSRSGRRGSRGMDRRYVGLRRYKQTKLSGSRCSIASSSTCVTLAFGGPCHNQLATWLTASPLPHSSTSTCPSGRFLA